MILIMFKVLLFCFVCCLADIQGSGPDRVGWPGYVFYPNINGWLKLHQVPTDYQDARVSCHLEDALLASAWNSNFTEAIDQLMSINTEEDSLPALYLGAQISFSDGIYRYVQGKPTLSLGPNNMDGLERCVALFANGTTGAVDCQQKLPYICYAPVPACGDEPHEYKFSTETGNCYKFHARSVNWTEAYNACRNEGTHLAVLNSAAEANVLKNLFPSDGADFAAIGFYYWKPSGYWWTIHGETIQQAGYASWRTSEPTVGPSFSRGFIHREGTLYSYTPLTTAPYICEKNPTLLQKQHD